MSRIGPENDLSSRIILENIPEDDVFIATCNSSTSMRNICNQQIVWMNRLKRYYPNTLPFKERTGLTYKEFYPIASLMKRLVSLGELYPVIVGYKFGAYLSKLDFDYSVVLDNSFPESFNSYMPTPTEHATRELIKGFLTEHSSITKTRRFLEFLRAGQHLYLTAIYPSLYAHYLKDASNDFAIAVLEGKEIWTYYGVILGTSASNTRLKDYINKGLIKFEDRHYFIENIIEPDTYNRDGKISDWFLSRFTEPERVRIFTNYFLHILLSGDEIDFSNNLITYMVSRQIGVLYQFVLPTVTFMAIPGNNFNPDTFSHMILLCENLSLGGFYPPASILDDISDAIKEQYPEETEKLRFIIRRYED